MKKRKFKATNIPDMIDRGENVQFVLGSGRVVNTSKIPDAIESQTRIPDGRYADSLMKTTPPKKIKIEVITVDPHTHILAMTIDGMAESIRLGYDFALKGDADRFRDKIAAAIRDCNMIETL